MEQVLGESPIAEHLNEEPAETDLACAEKVFESLASNDAYVHFVIRGTQRIVSLPLNVHVRGHLLHLHIQLPMHGQA